MKRFVAALAVAGAITVVAAITAQAADKGGPAPEPTVSDVIPAIKPSCYVSALAGSSISSVKDETAALPSSLSASGWTIGAGLGCDVRFERIVLGVLGRIEAPVDTSGGVVDYDKSWSAAARGGYMLNTGLLAYALIGYESADFTLDGIDLSKNGIMVGGGLEVMLSKHLSLNAEYTQTLIDNIEMAGSKLKPESHKARIGLNWRFNSLFGD